MAATNSDTSNLPKFAFTAVLLVLLLALLWWLRPGSVGEVPKPGGGDSPARVAASEPAPAPPAVAPPPAPAVDLPMPEEIDPHGDLNARAEHLANRESTDLVCSIEPPIELARGHLLVGPPDHGPPYNGRIVQIVLGRAYMPFLRGRMAPYQHGWLAVPGYAPTRVDWRLDPDGDPLFSVCTPIPIVLQPSEVTISGTITNAAGEPEGKVFVEGCGNQAWTDVDGHYALDALPGPCRLEAFRRDGVWTARTEPVQLELALGRDEVVDFALPPERRGGMGLSVEAVDAGIAVISVLEGGGSDGLDVAAGDLIVEINGIASVDMSLMEFVEEAVGAHGTDVHVIVMRDGVEHELTITRKAMD